jgi:hypothetical protein
VLITGLDMPEAMATDDEPGGDHARGAVLLSGARPRRNAVAPYLGETIDQTIARKYGQDTILASLQLGVEDTGNFGNCNWGYSCAYTNSVSWTSPTQPLPTQVNPRVVFERLFGDGTSSEERLAGRQQNASILDSVTHELSHLKKDLGSGDRQRLDTYLTNISELERRIKIAMNNSIKEPNVEVPFGLPESKHVHFRLMYDLMALAFQGDITRSATYMLGRDLTGASFPESGFNGGWHGTSHHGDKPENVANYAKMNRYHVQNLAYFLEKLRAMPEGDGTVLDHSCLLWLSNMWSGWKHDNMKLPVVTAGRLGGTIETGRSLDYLCAGDGHRKVCSLYLSIMDGMGVTLDRFGDAEQPLGGFS